MAGNARADRQYWLLKTDPGEYGFEDILRHGRIPWDGVRDLKALEFMKGMRRGDEALVYHTARQRAIVGRVRIASDPYPDISNDDPRYLVVDVDSPTRLPKAVPVSRLRADGRFADLALMRHPQINVLPVPQDLHSLILTLAAQ